MTTANRVSQVPQSHMIGVAVIAEITARQKVDVGAWEACGQCSTAGQVTYHVADGTRGDSYSDERESLLVSLAGLRIDRDVPDDEIKARLARLVELDRPAGRQP